MPTAARTEQKPPAQSGRLATPTDLKAKNTAAVSEELNKLVADAFTLYAKTKNFHWHMSGPHFRDYHLLLDEQSDQIFATIDPLAERVRKLGKRTVLGLEQMLKLRSLKDNLEDYVPPEKMLAELIEDNKAMAASMRHAHSICDDNEDVATASLLEVYIDETERRTWFLFEASQPADREGH